MPGSRDSMTLKQFIADQPAIVQYVVAALMSSGMAVLFYFVGGSLAEVSNNSQTFYGVGFKAGGALGAFVIVFLMSVKAIMDLSKTVPVAHTPFDIRLKVKAVDQQFKQENYSGTASIKRAPSKQEDKVKVDPRWDGDGNLAVTLVQVFPNDQIAVLIESEDKRQWRVTGFLPSEPFQDARFLGPRVTGRREDEAGQGPTGGRSTQVEQGPSGSGPRTATGGRRIGVGPTNRDASGASKK